MANNQHALDPILSGIGEDVIGRIVQLVFDMTAQRSGSAGQNQSRQQVVVSTVGRPVISRRIARRRDMTRSAEDISVAIANGWVT